MDYFANYKCPKCGATGTVLFYEPVIYDGACKSMAFLPKNTEYDTYIGCKHCGVEMEMIS